MQTKYTYKEIWLIAYPILISLLMEQMIGMTDTAFLGRVGEIELGASAIAGIFYIVMFMVAFGFSIGAQILIARRNGEQQYKEIGNLFYQGVYFQLGMAAVMFAFPPHLRCGNELPQLACIRILFLLYGSDVPCVLSGNDTDQNADAELNRHGIEQCRIQLHPDIRKIRSAAARHCRSRHRLVVGGIGVIDILHPLHPSPYRHPQVRTGQNTGYPLEHTQTHAQRLFLDDGTEFPVTLHVVPALPLRRASGRTFAGRYQHHPQRIGHNVHGYDGIRFNLRVACQQPYRSRTHRLRAWYMPELQEAAVPSLWVLCSAYLFLVPANVYFQSVSGTGNTRTALALEMITLVVYTCYITYIVAYLKLDVAFAWTSEIVYSVGILVLCYFYMKKGKWSLKKI